MVGCRLELFAAVGVKPADDEEGDGDAEVDDVVHDDTTFPKTREA
jgi:hypothetical protein